MRAERSHPELRRLAEAAAAAERNATWTAAEEQYTRLFRQALREGEMRHASDALRGLARTGQQQGDYERAEELAELSLAIADRHGLTQEAARAVNTLAVIHYRQQDWQGARSRYEVALERALDAADHELIGWSFQNLGVLANIEGDLREARARYLESIASSVHAADRRTVMLSYNNLGLVSADLGEWVEAEVYFSRGVEIAEQLQDLPALARLRANRAEPLIAMGQLAAARATLDDASSVAPPDDHGVQADIARFRASIARREGCHPEAEALIAAALQHCHRGELALELAEALEELAEVHAARGRAVEATVTFRDARDHFQALHAAHDVQRVEARLLRLEAELR